MLPSINGTAVYYMTGKVPGAIDPAGTFHDFADAYSTVFADSVFNKLSTREPYRPGFVPTAEFGAGNGRKAVLHRIVVSVGVSPMEVIIELPTDTGTTVVLLTGLTATGGRIYEFSPGWLLPDGFRVRITHTADTGRVLIVYSLLEN